MAATTGISWTDATWNPVTGCTRVSPACDRCYAETFSERYRGTPNHYFENGFDLTLRPAKLTLPLRWPARRVFVNSMSDLFHQDIPTSYIAQVFAAMAVSANHQYQVLTKRHARMRAVLSDPDFPAQVAAEAVKLLADPPRSGYQAATGVPWAQNTPTSGRVVWPLPNVWLGVSVENQAWADTRIPILMSTPAAVRFLSCEPLLGPVDVTAYLSGDCPLCGEDITTAPCGDVHARMAADDSAAGIDWVICGGESGAGARPMHPDWARGLRDQCRAHGTAYFFKQWGGWAPIELAEKAPTRVVAVTATGEIAQTGQAQPTDDTVFMFAPRSKDLNTLDNEQWAEEPVR